MATARASRGYIEENDDNVMPPTKSLNTMAYIVGGRDLNQTESDSPSASIPIELEQPSMLSLRLPEREKVGRANREQTCFHSVRNPRAALA